MGTLQLAASSKFSKSSDNSLTALGLGLGSVDGPETQSGLAYP